MAGLLSGRQKESGSDEGVACSSAENGTGVSGGAQRHDSKVTIDDLPEEMMISIFSYLSARDKARAARVCTRWRDLVDDPWLWRKEKPLLHLDMLTSAEMDSLQRRKLRNAMVDTSDCEEVASLVEFVCTVSSLRWLFVFGGTLYMRKDLKTAFFQDLPQMKELTIACTIIDPQVMEIILEKTKNLEVLKIKVVGGCIFSIISKNLKKLKSLRPLTYLEPESLDFHVLSVQHLPSLLELDLTASDGIGDSEMSFISEGLANLEVLRASLSSQTTQAGIRNLEELSSLRCLELREVPSGLSGWLGPLLGVLTQLRVLFLDCRLKITEDDAKAVAQLRHLEHVHLGGFGDRQLEALSHSRGRIRKLHLGHFDGETESGLKRISMLTELEDLTLIGSYAVDGALRQLSQGLPKLRNLRLLLYDRISEENCQYIAKMPSLKRIVFSDDMVTEVGKRYLLQSSIRTIVFI